MRLVTDGEKFAIRRGSWFNFYQYMDLKDGYWWTCPQIVEKQCWGPEHTVRKIFEEMKSKGKRKEWVVE